MATDRLTGPERTSAAQSSPLPGGPPGSDSARHTTGRSRGAHVRINGLTVVFRGPGGLPLAALRDLDFALEPSEFVSIVGPSGCGKSTLLMTLAGLQKPSTGRLLIDGEVVDGPSDAMGIAFQSDNLLEWRSVLANVLVQSDLRGGKRRELRHHAFELLDMVGLGEFASSHPRELSGGMRQRVALCRAVLHEPRLLLLDEPFGAVDAMTREQLNVDISELCKRTGVTALLVTHDIEEAVFMSDRVIVMSPRPGRIAGTIDVGEPTPRSATFRESESFTSASRTVRRLLERVPGTDVPATDRSTS